MKREKLRQARIKKGLSQQAAAELIGVSRNAWSLWERGKEDPYPVNVKELCTFFGVDDPGELDLQPRPMGVSKDEKLQSSINRNSSKDRANFLSAEIEKHEAQEETHIHSSQAIKQGIKTIMEALYEAEGVANLEPSRRRLLQQTLPLLFSLSSAISDTLITCIPALVNDNDVFFYSTAIPACWSLVYSGGIEYIEKVLPTYLAHLTTLTFSSSQDRKLLASFASQGYKLANLLDLRHENFSVALQHSETAFLYGQIAEDPNLQAAALIEEALTFQYRRRLPQTFASYQKALQIANGATSISPIIKGRTYGGLAVACARLGQEQEALRYIGLAYETFPEYPENDLHFSYTHYSHYYLYLYEGIMYTELRQPKNALAAYAHFHGAEYEPRRIEIANKEAASLLITGDLDQCSDKIKQSVNLSLSTKSDLRYSEAYEVYQEMRRKWPHEQKVKNLDQMFQK